MRSTGSRCPASALRRVGHKPHRFDETTILTSQAVETGMLPKGSDGGVAGVRETGVGNTKKQGTRVFEMRGDGDFC